uniref:SFRICE_009580 n=1 Tax=Spodoptera frugiperda TaxID=7108 RepID=A0A2H1VWJ6_SPOFR
MMGRRLAAISPDAQRNTHRVTLLIAHVRTSGGEGCLRRVAYRSSGLPPAGRAEGPLYDTILEIYFVMNVESDSSTGSSQTRCNSYKLRSIVDKTTKNTGILKTVRYGSHNEINQKILLEEKDQYGFVGNIINVKGCLFGCFYVNHAKTTERILIKFRVQTGYELTWVIGYYPTETWAKPQAEAIAQEIRPCSTNFNYVSIIPRPSSLRATLREGSPVMEATAHWRVVVIAKTKN